MEFEKAIPELLDEDWQKDAIVRARMLFTNERVQPLAVMMARTGRYAIEYMEQCPALIVFAQWGVVPKTQRERLVVAARFGSAVSRGLKLKDMMREFNGPLQARQLASRVCIPSNFRAILDLRQIEPSDLAQAIPEKSKQQAEWLRSLRLWKYHNDRDFGSDETRRRLHWDWFVKAAGAHAKAGHRIPDSAPLTIMDMLHRSRPARIELNPAWTLAGALAAAERWHEETTRRNHEASFLARNGFGFEQQRDYAPLPHEASFGKYTLTALRSGMALFTEGRDMRHCVASYVRDVMIGQSRIYSITAEGRRVATMELLPHGELYSIRQLVGPANQKVSNDVRAAANGFLSGCNAAIIEAKRAKAKDWTKSGAYKAAG